MVMGYPYTLGLKDNTVYVSYDKNSEQIKREQDTKRAASAIEETPRTRS